MTLTVSKKKIEENAKKIKEKPLENQSNWEYENNELRKIGKLSRELIKRRDVSIDWKLVI